MKIPDFMDNPAIHAANAKSCFALCADIMQEAVDAGYLKRIKPHCYDIMDHINGCSALDAARDARKRGMYALLQCGKANGRAYWQERGIVVGDKVFGVFGTIIGTIRRVTGVAKIGKSGAYVTSPAQMGKLSPHYFQKEVAS